MPDGVRVVVVGVLPRHHLSQSDSELSGVASSNDGLLQSFGDDVSNTPKGAREPPNLAVVGGDCSIVGFDENGVEAFWTVCGDNVGAMAVLNNNSGSSSSNSSSKGTSSNTLPWADMAVGCDDFALRFFKVWKEYATERVFRLGLGLELGICLGGRRLITVTHLSLSFALTSSCVLSFCTLGSVRAKSSSQRPLKPTVL